jgi:kynurenine 3-monooxygenase
MVTSSVERIAVVGGGLVGSLLSIYLVRRGFDVQVFEARHDLRQSEAEGGRSINLIVTSRGIHALRELGLDADVFRLTVPVMGRMMHTVGSDLAYQPYGRNESECNYSVSRSELNRFLLTEAERQGARFHFGHKLLDADLDAGRLRFTGGEGQPPVEVETDVVFGADGFGSAVRESFADTPEFRQSVEMLPHGYKELVIPAGPDGSFRARPDALHIWPRGEFMLMALPNLDGSFTVTLYTPHQGDSSFEQLKDGRAVVQFFESHFPDALELIPDLTRDFFDNATGKLGTVRCSPWNHGARAVLLGDAAHAIVPFFGQGMNCGFEDCTVLDDLLETHGNDWGSIFPELSRNRKPDADAIAEMALENFVEMRDSVGDPGFLLRKQVEQRVESRWPEEYRSRYSMVTYSTIPYRVAQEAGEIQRGILDELCRGISSADEADLDRAHALIGERFGPFLARRSVSLDY